MATCKTDDGCNIAYKTLGNGQRNVVFVHGWTMSGAVYNDLFDVLPTTGLKLIAPDLRGSGLSDKPKGGHDIERFAKDVLAAATDAGMERFTVVGHSMGGQIAQWLGATEANRIEGMVLLCPVPASGMQFPPDVLQFFETASTQNATRSAILKQTCKQLSPTALARLSRVAEETSEPCVRESLVAFRRADFASKLSSITAPTLVVSSDDPAITSDLVEREVANKIRTSRFVRVPGVGHYVAVEAPVYTAHLIQAFLAGSEPR